MLWHDDPPRCDPAWVARVNVLLSAGDLQRPRESVARDRPFGGEEWTRQTTRTLGLEATLRNRGGPWKQEIPSLPFPPRSLPSEERHLLESQAVQNLLHPYVGQRPDPFSQAGLFDRRDLCHDYNALLGKVRLAYIEQDIPRFARSL
jgi:hypothetical protein